MGEGTKGALCVSASAATRLAAARTWLSQQDATRPLCIVTPTLAAGARLVHGMPAGVRFGWRRFTLDGLVDALAVRTMARLQLAPARAASERALCARALEVLRVRGALGRLAPVADRPGLVDAAVATLRELRHAGTLPTQLAAQRPELAALLEAYEQVAAQAGLADAARRRALAADAAEANAPPLAGAPLLLLDVSLWLPSEQRLLAACIAGASTVFVAQPEGDPETRAFLSGFDFAAAESPPSSPLAPLHDGLFGSDTGPLPAQVAERVHWAACVGESRECVEIARQLRDRARAGTPFDAMAVVLRSPDTYRAPLEEALERAGVPAHYARGVRRPEPAGRALLVLLRCARDGLSARAFAEYLSLGQTPNAAEPSFEAATGQPLSGAMAVFAEPAAEPSEQVLLEQTRAHGVGASVPRRFERWLVESAVVGGLERWRRRLDGLVRAQEQALAEHEESGPSRVRLARELDEIRALRALALPLIERLAALPARASWARWLEALRGLAPAALRAPEPVLAALDELAPLGDIEDVGLEEVLRVLEGELGDALRPSTGLGAGRVFVGGVDDVAGMSFELVCVPGLTEKVFPHKDLEDPLLLDRARGGLEQALPTRSERLARERLRLRLAVGAAEQALWLSYPRVDSAQGKPRVPSLYALELLRLREGELLGLDELLRRADQGGASRLGWPAPADPAEAIDETEYDLAVLAEVLARPAEQTRGEARYLVQSHPVLARALRFRARRWHPKWNAADGLVAEGADDPVLAALAPHRLAARPHSATALESFAACPYRFFLRAVVGLSPRAGLAPIETLDPAQRGSLFHAAQRELLTELRDAGLLPLEEAGLEHARARLERVVERLAHEAREELAPAIAHVFEDAVEQIATDLRQWLGELAREPDWVPAHFELGFGLPSREGLDGASREDPVEVVGVQLRGAIDLVERRRVAAGGRGALRATDHKTGVDVGSLKTVRGGRTLQPVLYALALEQIFPDETVEGGRLYFCTSRGEFRSRAVALDGFARRTVQQLLGVIDGALAQGFLPARPDTGACASCDYQAVCGPYEEERTARKRRDPRLDGLYRIRGFK